jgi:hypothetical protein
MLGLARDSRRNSPGPQVAPRDLAVARTERLDLVDGTDKVDGSNALSQIVAGGFSHWREERGRLPSPRGRLTSLADRVEVAGSLRFSPRVYARPLQTSITLVLEHVDPGLSRAHRELYPERIVEHIPFSLTLLYPWLPAADVTEPDVERLRTYFARRPPLEFDLTRVTEFPGIVAYAVPEPDDELRALMRRLWKLYPECPPYGRPGSDPPPHATLTRYANPENASFEEAKKRVEPLLPVHCHVTEATLQEEYELDRMRIRDTFPFGSGV